MQIFIIPVILAVQVLCAAGDVQTLVIPRSKGEKYTIGISMSRKSIIHSNMAIPKAESDRPEGRVTYYGKYYGKCPKEYIVEAGFYQGNTYCTCPNDWVDTSFDGVPFSCLKKNTGPRDVVMLTGYQLTDFEGVSVDLYTDEQCYQLFYDELAEELNSVIIEDKNDCIAFYENYDCSGRTVLVNDRASDMSAPHFAAGKGKFKTKSIRLVKRKNGCKSFNDSPGVTKNGK